MSLIAELKRRNVFKVSVAYLALSWVVIEVSNTVVPVLHLPEVIPSIVIWLGVIGFPFAVLFSWLYELTPDGLKRESEINPGSTATQSTAIRDRKLDHIIIGLLVIAIGLFAFDRFFLPGTHPVQTETGQTAAIPPPSRAQTGEPSSAVDPSIAVLPFVNMSEDINNEYFSDGLSEELLNLLAKIPQLRVIARTSSFAFKGEKADIGTIGKKLQVTHVLEGSVRKAGNRVRITAQLIRVSDSSHLWSETYDRNLTDIFAVQDEIASAVVEQLRITLLGGVPKAQVIDPAAYALFLQARQLNRQYSREGFEEANILYRQVLQLASDYAPAWSNLARNYSDQSAYGLFPIDEGYRLAREAASNALAITPDDGHAQAVLGDIAMYYDGDLQSSAHYYLRALVQEPANPEIISGAGILAMSLGRMNTALALQEYAVAQDPLNPAGYFRTGFINLYLGRLDDAITSLRTALNLSEETIGARYFIAEALLLKGDAEGALLEIQKESLEPWGRIGYPLIYHALGRKTESDAALSELIATQEQIASYNIAFVYAYRGEADAAFEWLDKAVSYRDAGLSELIVQPLFANIHKDPRWLPLLRRIGRAPEQLAEIDFDVKVPYQ